MNKLGKPATSRNYSRPCFPEASCFNILQLLIRLTNLTECLEKANLLWRDRWLSCTSFIWCLCQTLHFTFHIISWNSLFWRDRSSSTKLNFEWVKQAAEQLSDSPSTNTTSSRIQVSRAQQNNLFTWAFVQMKVPSCITALLFLSRKSLHQLSTCFRRAADSSLHRTWNLGCGSIPASPPLSQVTLG